MQREKPGLKLYLEVQQRSLFGITNYPCGPVFVQNGALTSVQRAEAFLAFESVPPRAADVAPVCVQPVCWWQCHREAVAVPKPGLSDRR